MPRSAPRACTVSGCPALTCGDVGCLKDAHTIHEPKREPSEDRGSLSRDKAYNTARWAKLRTAQLSREPLCQRCLSFDLVTAGHDVDHIIPHQGDASKMWDKNNLQTLCKSCHTWKTNREKEGEHLDFRSYSTS